MVAGMAKKVSKRACIPTAFFLENFNSSIQHEIGISIIETREVNAAKKTSVKNTAATTLAPMYPTATCIDRKIFGRKLKISPMLLVERSSVLVFGSKAKMAGNIKSPAKKAILVSATATMRVDCGILSCFEKYDP